MERLTAGVGVAWLTGAPEDGWPHETWDEYATLSQEHIQLSPAEPQKESRELPAST